MRLSPEKRDAAGGDLDAVLASDAGDVARKIVRAGLGDFEEAVRIAGRVRCIDRCARLDLIECLHRGRRRAWRGERALGKNDGRRVGRCAGVFIMIRVVGVRISRRNQPALFTYQTRFLFSNSKLRPRGDN